MSTHNKVVWMEGMFLRPQHFQQQDRYFQRYVDGRTAAYGAYGWGFEALQVDHELLHQGKISITQCRGVFADGTPFNAPAMDAPPAVLDVPAGVHNQTVYLGLPIKRDGAVEVSEEEYSQGLARFDKAEVEVADNTLTAGERAKLDVAVPRLTLLLESDDLSGYSVLGVARILESRDDKQVVLDDKFIAPAYAVQVSTRLTGFLSELAGLLHHRGEALAGRLVDSGRSGSAEIADYMLLQLVNRLEPWVVHLSKLQRLHPADLYGELVQMCGELCTFTTRTKRPPELAPYLHDQLQQTFAQVMVTLRQCLSMVMEQTAIAMELAERKYGIRVAAINDRSLIGSATFILAVKADMKPELVRSGFPGQSKMGPVEKIRELVNLQLPGMTLTPLPVAPRQIPYHAGFTYFEVDKSSDFWRDMQQSGGFALHVGADIPGLEMEFWAIRD